MKAEDEIKLNINFEDLNQFVFDIDNLQKWLHYVEELENITINQEIKGSYVSMKINLFQKPKTFNFRISEFERNKKIRIKANLPFLFEITIKTYQALDGYAYLSLKTKCKPKSILFLFLRKRLKAKNRISLEILKERLKTF
jgi:hypothetical protein